MNADFKFHPVGHGLFYSGVIKARERSGEPFTFVYDCGGKDSKGQFNQFWDPLKKEHGGIRLTLLVISHFHKDHISGIPNLIKVARPKFVVMPYLGLVERVACVAILLSDSGSKMRKDELVELSKFILNPDVYCKEFGCQLYMVDPDVWAEVTPDQYDDLPAERLYDELCFPHETIDNSGCRKIRNGAVGLHAGWEFHFFMPKKASNCEEISDWVLRKGINEQWLASGEITDKLFDEIKNEFIHLDLKNNGSNLVCVHGPVHNTRNDGICVLSGSGGGYSSRLCVRRRGWHVECVMPSCLPVRQMLTGDAEFNEVANFSKWMSSDECNRVALFQVPHHGSRRNQEDWFERQLPNCVAWVVPHGFSKRDKRNIFKVNGTSGWWVYYVRWGLDVCLTSLH